MSVKASRSLYDLHQELYSRHSEEEIAQAIQFMTELCAQEHLDLLGMIALSEGLNEEQTESYIMGEMSVYFAHHPCWARKGEEDYERDNG
jgi:hypothetical protein